MSSFKTKDNGEICKLASCKINIKGRKYNLIMKLDGYKTKIVVVATILYAISGLILGHIDANTAITMILAAMGGLGIYHKLERNLDK